MKKYILLVLVSLVLVGFGIFLNLDSKTAEGSVAVTGEYYSTTTISMSAGTMNQIFSGVGVLGSIVISSSTQYGFNIWDSATSTSASSTNPVNASTTIIKMGASSANGTYTYDVVMTKGLVLDLPANFNGSVTVTYRR